MDYAIAWLVDQIYESFVKKEHILVVFIELSKAFNKVHHSIKKLKLYSRNYGIELIGTMRGLRVIFPTNRSTSRLIKTTELTIVK